LEGGIVITIFSLYENLEKLQGPVIRKMCPQRLTNSFINCSKISMGEKGGKNKTMPLPLYKTRI
jgi:hypothetical protein